MVKDRVGRFSDHPLWGDGWGWALLPADAPDTKVTTDFRNDGQGCHHPPAENDWVYLQGYPVLRRGAQARP